MPTSPIQKKYNTPKIKCLILSTIAALPLSILYFDTFAICSINLLTYLLTPRPSNRKSAVAASNTVRQEGERRPRQNAVADGSGCRPPSQKSLDAHSGARPRAGSGVVIIDLLRFLAGCRKMRLNQALSILSRRGGFKAESLRGHITIKAFSPLLSPPSPPLPLLSPPFPSLPSHPLPFSLPSLRSRPLKSSQGVWRAL